MSYCGGIKLGNGLKLIKGIICDETATTVDKTKAVSTCGQLWDGSLFATSTVDGSKVITLHNSEGEEVGTPVLIKGNCGVGLDGRFFKVVNGSVTLQDGFVLTVNVTPTDSTIVVKDADSAAVSPIAGTTNQFLLDGLGDSYTIQVSKTGFTSQTKTIINNKDQTVAITLVASA
nr:MAG TPA: hypothetical protein [Caudoviricetes sp.]